MPISGRRRVIPMGFRGAANWHNKPADPRKSRASRRFVPLPRPRGCPRGVDRRSTICLFCRRRSLVLPRVRGNHAPPFDGCARYLRPFIIISLNAEQPRPPMSLIYRLASRNLFHDRLRFVATVVGIVFSIVLVTVQLGLYLGFGRVVTTMIDHATADLWIMPLGTKCFEDPALLDERERFRTLSVPGVVEAAPVLVSFAQWHIPSGGTTPVLLIGSDRNELGLQPWNVVAGNLYDLAIPDAVAVDRSYFERLGTSGLSDTVEIRDLKAKIRLVTQGIRSFTTTPYVFTPLDRARSYAGISPNKATYLLVRLQAGANAESVRTHLNETLAKAEALTPDAFRSRSRSFWLFGTG